MRFTHIIILTIAALMPVVVYAANPAQEVDVLELNLDQNIATPEVPKKARNYVRTAMDQLRRHLVKSGFEVEMLREGEVIELTIPCADLFGAGAVELNKSASDRLRPLGIVAREPLKYKILVAVHTDDTGDEVYADSISAARANAIDDFLWQLSGNDDTNVVPYGIGKDEPRVPNTTRVNRAINRRVEIFIVPDKKLFELAGVKS